MSVLPNTIGTIPITQPALDVEHMAAARKGKQMATFRRRGHYRVGKGGKRHWVSAHSVTRNGRTAPSAHISSPQWHATPKLRSKPRTARPRPQSSVIMTPPVRWKFPLDEPNSRCPKCRQPVWFFRNKRGGCAYFDAVGKPWPLHPCMEAWKTDEDARAVQQAISSYDRAMRTSTAAFDQHARTGQAHELDAHAGPAVQGRAVPSDTSSIHWLALSGLLATLESLPLAIWALSASEGGSVLLLLWAIIVPLIVMPIALVLAIDNAPHRFDGRSWALAVVTSPTLMIAGILANFFTVGFALPVLAVLLSRRALNARDHRSRHSPPPAADPPEAVPPVVTDQ